MADRNTVTSCHSPVLFAISVPSDFVCSVAKQKPSNVNAVIVSPRYPSGAVPRRIVMYVIIITAIDGTRPIQPEIRLQRTKPFVYVTKRMFSGRYCKNVTVFFQNFSMRSHERKVKNYMGLVVDDRIFRIAKHSNFTRCRFSFLSIGHSAFTRRSYSQSKSDVHFFKKFYFHYESPVHFTTTMSHGVFPMNKLENVKTIYRVKNPWFLKYKTFLHDCLADGQYNRRRRQLIASHAVIETLMFDNIFFTNFIIDPIKIKFYYTPQFSKHFSISRIIHHKCRQPSEPNRYGLLQQVFHRTKPTAAHNNRYYSTQKFY